MLVQGIVSEVEDVWSLVHTFLAGVLIVVGTFLLLQTFLLGVLVVGIVLIKVGHSSMSLLNVVGLKR